MREQASILLVEDDRTIRTELELHWQRLGGWRVQTCARLSELPEALARSAPDVIVLDRQLPDGNALDWLDGWRQKDPHTSVIILTAMDRVMDRVEGLRRGADDYLVKPFAPEELDARIVSLLRRTGATQGTRLQFGPLLWLQEQGEVRVDGVVLELHPRELEVLGLLIRRAPRLVPRRVLVDALAERNLELTDAAVDVYISRLRRKLAGRGVEIVTARGFGYRLDMSTAGGNETGGDDGD